MVKRVNKERKCPLCDFIAGQDRGLCTHIKNTHDITGTIEELYIKLLCDNKVPTCTCGCGKITKFNGWANGYAKFIIGHNGDLSYLTEIEITEIKRKRNESLAGKSGWSKGLTKETHAGLAKGAIKRSETVKEQFASGERTQWHKGLTKETDSRVAKMAETLKDGFASGERTQWHKGLTKETDSRVAKLGKNTSKAHRNVELRKKLDAKKRLNPNEIKKRIKKQATNFTLVSPIEEYLRDITKNLKFKCLQCGLTHINSLSRILTCQCPGCGILGSKAQTEIFHFIHNISPDVISNDRNQIAPKELDLWLPEANLAIEFNGLFYHSDYMNCDKNYHINKTNACAKKGITLIHIFEDEWRDKRNIIMSMLRHRLGKTEQRIGARKCTIAIATASERKNFFNQNHIDGNVAAKIGFGLFYNNEMVACLSLRRPKHKKYTSAWEVARFCSMLNTTTNGALSRLTKAALNWARLTDKKELMTYVDERHGNGEAYLKTGWRFVNKTPTMFWWTDTVSRFNRFKYRANKAEGMTEFAVAEQAGVKKIWGCQNKLLMIS